MTEAPSIVTRTDPGCAPLEELCGRAVDQIQVQVVDESDRPIPACDVGEICVMPATTGVYANVYTIMLGYWNKPEASAIALSKGMYHTGDVGYLDERGQLFIRGRQNDLIIRGGSNVYPAEVERVICSHPSVADAAVLGIQDDRLGQRVVAVLEHSDMSGTIDEVSLITEIQSYCREKIARYKVPQQIVFIEKLPRNAMNKIVKLQLLHLFE
jgi:acyl-CoA synthetase (AMP-forming)/AMP-acid ligase II